MANPTLSKEICCASQRPGAPGHDPPEFGDLIAAVRLLDLAFDPVCGGYSMKIGAKQDVPVELRLARAVCPNRVDGNPKANLVLRFGQLPRIGASSKPARK
jgi:hypothetical protein